FAGGGGRFLRVLQDLFIVSKPAPVLSVRAIPVPEFVGMGAQGADDFGVLQGEVLPLGSGDEEVELQRLDDVALPLVPQPRLFVARDATMQPRKIQNDAAEVKRRLGSLQDRKDFASLVPGRGDAIISLPTTPGSSRRFFPRSRGWRRSPRPPL